VFCLEWLICRPELQFQQQIEADIRKHADESDVEFEHEKYSAAAAVCWAPGRTIGNIAVSSEEVFGYFEEKSGNNAILPCHIIPCGKFRNGAPRWYCKTHQIHWGTNADIAALPESGEVLCSNHLTEMSYVVNPLEVSFNEYEEIGIWCSLPEAISSRPIIKRAPKIHVHKQGRIGVRSKKTEHPSCVVLL
jgi:hypothetical protein